VEDVCNEDDNTITSSTPLTLSCEAHNTSAHDGQVDGSYGEMSQSGNVEDSTSYLSSNAHDNEGVLEPKYDEVSTPYPIYDTYDDASIMVPKYDEDWVFEKLSCDIDISSQEPCVEDDKEGVDLVDENKSEILYQDDSSHESHHCMVSYSKSIGVYGERCYQLSLAHSSSLTAETPSYLESVTPEGMHNTHDLREKPLMMSPYEENSKLQVLQFGIAGVRGPFFWRAH